MFVCAGFFIEGGEGQIESIQSSALVRGNNASNTSSDSLFNPDDYDEL